MRSRDLKTLGRRQEPGPKTVILVCKKGEVRILMQGMREGNLDW